MSEILDTLILIARPGAGKSEIIDYLKHASLQERRQRFHVGEIREIDDFPMLWTWFEEDEILSQLGHPRLHTTEDGYFRWTYLWDVLIRRIGLDYHKMRRDDASGQPGSTTIIEFSRGLEHGGFQRAFEHLHPEILTHAVILYINVSYAESLRKNRRRFNPERPDSILQHGLSDEKLTRLYRDSDWESMTAGHPEHLDIQGMRVPYTVFENEDDVTTPGGAALDERLEQSLSRLWAINQA